MAIPLIIGKDQKDDIKKLIKHAEKNKIALSKMNLIASGSLPPVGDLRGFSISLPVGFRVVFSIEQHPGGWMKHISISLNAPGRVPNEHAIQMIMDEFAMGKLNESYVSFEKEVGAVNVINNLIQTQEKL